MYVFLEKIHPWRFRMIDVHWACGENLLTRKLRVGMQTEFVKSRPPRSSFKQSVLFCMSAERTRPFAIQTETHLIPLAFVNILISFLLVFLRAISRLLSS